MLSMHGNCTQSKLCDHWIAYVFAATVRTQRKLSINRASSSQVEIGTPSCAFGPLVKLCCAYVLHEVLARLAESSASEHYVRIYMCTSIQSVE